LGGGKLKITTYYLTHTVNFATRIQNDSSTAIDNIFVDSIRFSSSPIINGLSDHDAQYPMINNIAAAGYLIPLKQRTRKVNNETIMQFQFLLKSETWESVFKTMIPTKNLTHFCILSLRSKNSSRYDEITSKILKACTAIISHPLAHICNHSQNTGIFPDHLKMSVVKPLHKKGDKTSMTNYRPISL
jgi:hypothetical protein